MESLKEKRIVIQDIPDYVTDFLKMENSTYKRILFTRNLKQTHHSLSSILFRGDCIYHSLDHFAVKQGKDGYYLKRKKVAGFTFDEKKKLRIWYGKTTIDIPLLGRVFEHLGLDWFIEPTMHDFLTRLLLEKMLKGIITNPVDFFKHFLKSSRIKASPKLLFKAVEKGIEKYNLVRYAHSAVDVDVMLKVHIARSEIKPGIDDPSNIFTFHSLQDLIDQANILERKIDYKWSANRAKEMHKLWTREIMEIELQHIEDKSIPKADLYPELPPEIKLLKTQREVFAEGKIMDHCVYTNYWSDVERGTYLVFHINLKGEEATLGCDISGRGLTYSQCYRVRNGDVSEDMEKFAKWFVKNYSNEFRKIRFSNKEIALDSMMDEIAVRNIQVNLRAVAQ